MNRFLPLSLGAALLCIPPLADAAVMSRDWKTLGDGLLTYDDVNKREWLDLPVTLLSSQFPGQGANFFEIWESRYQYVVSQTAPGGAFAGFAVAKSAEVVALAQSAGINTTTIDIETNRNATLSLIELLGPTPLPNVGEIVSRGALDEIGPRPNSGRMRAVFGLNEGRGAAGMQFEDHIDLSASFWCGVMLSRVIPEPDPVVSLSIGIAALFLVRPHLPSRK